MTVETSERIIEIKDEEKLDKDLDKIREILQYYNRLEAIGVLETIKMEIQLD